MSGPLGWRRVSGCKRPAHLLGREGGHALRQGHAGFCGRWLRAGRCMGQPRIQRMRQAPGAGGVGFFLVCLAAGCVDAGFICRISLRATGGCRGHLHAAHCLANVPCLVQGHPCQGVEQRGQQKQDVEVQGGDGAAQHEGMRIILKCGVASRAGVKLSCGKLVETAIQLKLV